MTVDETVSTLAWSKRTQACEELDMPATGLFRYLSTRTARQIIILADHLARCELSGGYLHASIAREQQAAVATHCCGKQEQGGSDAAAYPAGGMAMETHAGERLLDDMDNAEAIGGSNGGRGGC